MIKKHTGCGVSMAKVLLTSMDEELVAKAVAHHGKRDVYVAMDVTVLNTMMAVKVGLDTHALVGKDADPLMFDACECITPKPTPTPVPAKKALKPKKVEAKKDEPTTE
tara:strand:- start:739 stop:1062 length:324 start_codon:yes stop_codon:yes gene_type:complete